MNEQQTATQTPAPVVKPTPKKRSKPKRQPKYNVVLIDDNDHTYEYVIRMLGRVFGYSRERAFQLACEVDNSGRVILLTTTLEHAELKRDQIHAYGPDPLIALCTGSMTSVLEPVGA